MANEQVAGLLQIFKQCGCKGCVREGKHMPFVVVRLVGQTVVEKPIRIQVPMYLCDVHMNAANPNDMLTRKGRLKIDLMTAQKYRRRVNWDTVCIEWASLKDNKVIH